MINEKKSLQDIPKYKAGKTVQELQKNSKLPLIKLSSNENPLGCAINLNDLENLDLNVYPHQESSQLVNELENIHNVKSSNIILGNGSDEIFQFCTSSLLNETDEVISSEHTFAMYEINTKICSAKFISVPMKDFSHDLDGLLNAITHNTKIIFIANPNNPTGTYITPENLEGFIKKVPSNILIVIDQAYIEYVDESLQLDDTKLINTYENVLITRTFSKIYGLAGLRLGYGIGSDSLIATLKKVKPPFNVNNIALSAGYLALKNSDFVARSIENNKKNMQKIKHCLTLKNIEFIPSNANFICIKTKKPAFDTYSFFLNNNIIVRDCSSFGLPHHIRLTIGNDEQTNKIIKLLEILND